MAVCVVAHPHSAGAAGKTDQAIGRSVAKNSTKIHMATDAFGLPLDFILTGREVHECKVATPFIENLPVADYVMATKAMIARDSDDYSPTTGYSRDS